MHTAILPVGINIPAIAEAFQTKVARLIKAAHRVVERQDELSMRELKCSLYDVQDVHASTSVGFAWVHDEDGKLDPDGVLRSMQADGVCFFDTYLQAEEAELDFAESVPADPKGKGALVKVTVEVMREVFDSEEDSL